MEGKNRLSCSIRIGVIGMFARLLLEVVVVANGILGFFSAFKKMQSGTCLIIKTVSGYCAVCRAIPSLAAAKNCWRCSEPESGLATYSCWIAWGDSLPCTMNLTPCCPLLYPCASEICGELRRPRSPFSVSVLISHRRLRALSLWYLFSGCADVENVCIAIKFCPQAARLPVMPEGLQLSQRMAAKQIKSLDIHV